MLKKININELKEGMILGEDFYSHDLKVLISKGKTLDQHLVNYIKEKSKKNYIVIYIKDPTFNNINKIEIKENNKKEEIRINDVVSVFKDKDIFQKVRENYNKIKKGIKEAFDFLETNNEINDEKFINIAKYVIENLSALEIDHIPEFIYLIELEKWHPDTFNHSIDVAFFTLYIASQITTDKEELMSIFLGGLLHDIGKYIRYKEGDKRFYEIITKNSQLTDEEHEILKKHVDVEKFFENKFSFFSKKQKENIVYGALDHHEKLDGSGYIKGKKGYQISLAGRIVAIADIYDALIRKREYKSMVKPDIAMKHIVELSEKGKLDKTLVNIFKKLMGRYPTGTVISTNKGFAVVTKQSDNPERPFILLIDYHELGEIDLSKDNSIIINDSIDNDLNINI
ncbi:MAG TPA: HD domain-containing protein [Spirochaetota bacterium]|nr:HD domain-containing protein [Spirochaetota bacterium]HOM38249.1 HD domain-containing protein [Spirochaetota bacterium]HPQ48533.1 HD domain-containing protein [Spirochaetota bacterium]